MGQESTMRDYGPALGDLRRALGGVLARSLSDEHFEAYKRAKLDGIDVGGGDGPVRRLSAATVNKRLDLAHRVISEAIRRGAMDGPNPVEEVVRPRDPKREQMVLTKSELRRLIDAADTLELRALVRCFCELALRFSEATGLPIPRFLGHHSVTFTLAKYGSHFSKGMLEPAEYLTDLEVAELGDAEPGAAGSI
jgi:hypothetical protein